MKRPKLHILFDDMARVYDRTEADALFESIEALHREIIDQGRKVLNSTSDKGMSHTEYIEWAMDRLEK